MINHNKKANNAKFLHDAIINDNYNRAKKVVKRDFRISRETCEEIFDKGNLKYFILLLESNKDIASIYGNYPIKMAAQYGHTEMVKLLLKQDLNISASDNYALEAASECGYSEITELLLNDKRLVVLNRHNYLIRNVLSQGHGEIAYMLWNNNIIRKYTVLHSSVDGKINPRFLQKTKEFEIRRKIDIF